MLEWDVLATWLGLLLTTGGVIYKMGQQSQRIDDQARRLESLQKQVDANAELPIKLAAFETDIKYLVRELTDIKTILLKKVIE
jgi:hypothetical protein